MYRLFQFIYRYRTFFTFLVIQLICAVIIVRKNTYHHIIYYGTTNRVVANLVSGTNYIKDFFFLREVNADLADENARLKKELSRLKMGIYNLDTRESKDGDLINKYDFVRAKVIDNSVNFSRNYITLDKGLADGIEEGMGVINSNGLVGKIKSVSEHFAVAASLLHIDILTSSAIKRNDAFGTLRWDGIDKNQANLDYVPRHVEIQTGDSVITSGYNAIYPKGIFIGTIRDFEVVDESAFYDIYIDLAVDFLELSHVYIIENTLKEELDSLETNIIYNED